MDIRCGHPEIQIGSFLVRLLPSFISAAKQIYLQIQIKSPEPEPDQQQPESSCLPHFRLTRNETPEFANAY